MEKLMNLQSLIQYLIDTTDDEWIVDVVRSGNKNCFFGHLVDWYYGKGYEGKIGEAWDAFENMWANTYMIYPVNDGQHPEYQQSTARERVIAYITDLWLGLQVDINTGMEREWEKHQLRQRQLMLH